MLIGVSPSNDSISILGDLPRAADTAGIRLATKSSNYPHPDTHFVFQTYSSAFTHTHTLLEDFQDQIIFDLKFNFDSLVKIDEYCNTDQCQCLIVRYSRF